MNKRISLSVTIITLNEEADVGRAIDSVKPIASEIVVVDSGSTDKTVELARKKGAKVYYRDFDNYADQKNYAVGKTSAEWVFSLDADEIISPDLVEEIRQVLNNPKYDGYSMPRKNNILGEYINHSRWQPELDRHIWLFRRGKGRWVGNVHEEVKVAGSVGRLNSPKLHYSHKTISQFVAMMNNYSNLEAEKRVKENSSFSPFKMFFDPLYNFCVRYLYRLGFLDGWRGFVLAYLMAIYHLELWVKVWAASEGEGGL